MAAMDLQQQLFEKIKEIRVFYPYCNVTDATCMAYASVLKTQRLEEVERALDCLLTKSKYFPALAEIITEVERKNDRPLVAWMLVEEVLRKKLWIYNLNFGDLVTHAAILSLGGLERISKREDELHFLQKEFCTRFSAFEKRSPTSIPAALLAPHAPTSQIFNLALDGFYEINNFLKQEKIKEIEQLKLDIEWLMGRPSKCGDYDLMKVQHQILSCRERIDNLEKEIKKEDLLCVSNMS